MIFFLKKFDTNICSTILLLFVIVIVQCQDTNEQGNNIVTKLAEANNDFGLFIYSILATPHGNEIISPISLLSAFGNYPR